MEDVVSEKSPLPVLVDVSDVSKDEPPLVVGTFADAVESVTVKLLPDVTDG